MFSNNSFRGGGGGGGYSNNNRNNNRKGRGGGGRGGGRTNCFKSVTAFSHGKLSRGNHKHSSFGGSSKSTPNGTLSMIVGQMDGNWFMCTAGGSQVKLWNLQTLQARKPPQLVKQRDLTDKYGMKMDIGSALCIPNTRFLFVGLAGTWCSSAIQSCHSLTSLSKALEYQLTHTSYSLRNKITQI